MNHVIGGIYLSESGKYTSIEHLDAARLSVARYEHIRKKLPPRLADEIAHIVSEVGELYQNLRNRETRTKILEELVDIILTTLQVANSMNFTTDEIFSAIREKTISLDERTNAWIKGSEQNGK